MTAGSTFQLGLGWACAAYRAATESAELAAELSCSAALPDWKLGGLAAAGW